MSSSTKAHRKTSDKVHLHKPHEEVHKDEHTSTHTEAKLETHAYADARMNAAHPGIDERSI